MSQPLYLHLSRMPRVFVEGRGIGIEYTRGSQWMGYPVMPRDFPLPTIPNPSPFVPYVSAWDGKTVECPEFVPMPFLCQIDCREIPAEVADLPHDGMLYFFTDIHYYRGLGHDPMPMYAGEKFVRVIYIPEDGLTDMVVHADMNHCSVEMPERITLNFERPTGEEADHQLLVEPKHREREDWDEPYEGWRVLFQMDSCDGAGYHYNFMNRGVFDILISPDDLRRRDFGHVVGIVLST